MGPRTRPTGRLRAAVVALALAAAGLVGGATPAQAAHPPCGPHEDAYDVQRCGPTDILRPAGAKLTRAELFKAAGLYAARGFHSDFLWFAPEQKVDIAGLPRWAGCFDGVRSNNGADGICDDGEPITFGHVGNDLGGTQITVFGDRNAYIALICGNFSETRPPATYRPHLTGTKFHDRDADGARDGSEEALGGWQYRVTLVEPVFPGQERGRAQVVETAADGRWRLDLSTWGPGTYRVEELTRDGWRVTNGAVRDVVVQPGIGNDDVDAGAWGNVRETDTAKTEFALVAPPSRIDADTPTDLTVKVVLTNHGPADTVEVTDVVVAEAHKVEPRTDDCTFVEPRKTVRATLREGESKEFLVPFRVTCTEPSEHDFTFTDELRNDDDVQETRPEDNTRRFTARIPVWDASDLALEDTSLDCTPTTKVDTAFTCTGTTTAVNHGPFGPTEAATTLSLTGPQDCTPTPVTPASASSGLDVGGRATLTTTWDVVCTARSFHPFALEAEVQPVTVHVEDRDPGDNTAGAEDTTEVFQDVDLEVLLTGLACSEREANRTASVCEATVVLTNAGPADAVHTLLDLDVTPGQGCTATPAHVRLARTLAAGTSSTVVQRVGLACTTDVRHEVRVDALLRNDRAADPHAVDEDRDRLLWVPTDAKPTSFPSSVNLGKEGALPFAVLSTAGVDALTQVDRASLRYGVTGTEDSVQGCKTEGEDPDADGRLDLVCHADTQRAGITCSTTVLQLTGRLHDGTRLVSQDEIKVLGCRKA